MKKAHVALLVLAAAALPVQAHFIYLVPGGPDSGTNTISMVFSDNLKPDADSMLLKKILHTELFACILDGKKVALKHSEGKDAINVAVPAQGLYLVAGVCKYGVVKRGESEPFLLNYYPKTFVGLSEDSSAHALYAMSAKLPLEIIPQFNKGGAILRVLWQGKPLPDAEVAVVNPDGTKGPEGRANHSGVFILKNAAGKGLYGIRARHEEKTDGELDGKKYSSIRHYATLALALVPADKADAPKAGALRADPEATKLLADARAARANWDHFPGFHANAEVNIDGKVFHSPLTVTAGGTVQLKIDDADAQTFAHRSLASLVGHRTDNSAPTNSPCAFADTDTENPLGRAIAVLDDEFHSSYRIRDRQVIVVNRVTKDSRFTITVLENKLNEEKQYLPVSFVVNYWDTKGEALKRSEAHHQTWTRVGKFDLPADLLVVTATPTKQEARSIKVSGYRLIEPGVRGR